MEILGIDVGGSGMKGGIVDIETGEMISERHRHSHSRSPYSRSNGRCHCRNREAFRL